MTTHETPANAYEALDRLPQGHPARAAGSRAEAFIDAGVLIFTEGRWIIDPVVSALAFSMNRANDDDEMDRMLSDHLGIKSTEGVVVEMG